NFKDTLGKGKKYYWDFGDGRKDTTLTFQNSITYNNVGVYRVMLISEDSSTCNIRDTAYVMIRAGNNEARLGFTAKKLPPCESLTMRFTNTSTAPNPNFGPRSFIWDYGDGSPKDTAGLNPPRQHTYAAAGNYVVTLRLIDTLFCNAPLELKDTIRLNPIVDARFSTPPAGCAPYDAIFFNESLAGTDWLWQFGDGTTSTEENPTHTYLLPGSYRVRLIATDTSTCNRVDTSAYFTILVSPKPTAAFTWTPNPPQENVPVSFFNQSSADATRFLWDFGDGESSELRNPVHEYNATGQYKATLYAFNPTGCVDSTSRSVDVIVIPLLDVPNAFTPSQGGINSVVFVRGFGIGKMQWNIYNRWGQLVFSSTNKRTGWNGTFKGKLQPMDVYTYTLDAELTDGQKIRKTGD
ncbi:MAG: PKD domain-containing protein, partial [Pedobacter sp.]